MPSIFDAPEPAPSVPAGSNAQAADSRARIGEAERADALAMLSRQFSEGRLTADEFSQRCAVVAGAVTRADLGGVFEDLPVGSIEDRLRAKEAAQAQQATLAAGQAQQSRDRSAVATRLLYELTVRTLEVLKKRQYPRGLEIVSVKCGIPGTMTVRPVRVATGRAVWLTCPRYPFEQSRTTWAISDDAELLTFTFADGVSFHRGWPSASYPISGSGKNILNSEKRKRAAETVRNSVQAAVESAGCAAPVAELQPLQAYGEPQQKNFGYDTGVAFYPVFYLDDSDRLVYGTNRSPVDAEEMIAGLLF